MRIFQPSLILACLAFVSAKNHFRYHVRDAGTQLTPPSSEGEDHNPIQAPVGSTFTSFSIPATGEDLALFSSSPTNSLSTASQAFIVIHGKLRNGGEYWKVMNDVLQSALKTGAQNVDKNALIIAPQFFSAQYNSGQYSNTQLAWADVNAWQAGDVAVHPSGTRLTSIDALDALITSLLDSKAYPTLRNITVVGHGGGGQLVQRYATVGKDFSGQSIHLRYIHADPSSCAYFTTDRPTMSGAQLPSKASCPLYNTWRYGFDNFTTSSSGQTLSAEQYYAQYISRDVISMIGYQDVKASGDDNCPAVMQGGLKRRDRNLIWWRYINTLGRTSESLSGFPGSFASLPDWSGQIGPNGFQTKLIIIANATHSPSQVFNSPEGFSALFARADQIVKGYRPPGNSPSTSQSQTSSASGSKISGTGSTSTTGSVQSSHAYRSAPTLLQSLISMLLATFLFVRITLDVN